jgi:hypothetical protein
VDVVGADADRPTRGADPLGGLPADPASVPSHPALSDVAFESKRKGVREALPAECWER